MRTIIVAIIIAAILAPGAVAVGDKVLERRVAKLEKRLKENYRRDMIVQNVLYMKGSGMYPQFLQLKMHFYECLEVREDGVFVANPYCAGVFGIQAE